MPAFLKTVSVRGVSLLILLASLLAGCGEKPPIVLGYIGGLTGRTADLGTAGRNGIQLAIDEINALGGIGGRRIQLVIKDDESTPDKGVLVTRELIDAKVDAILGPMTSNVAAVVAPLATQAGMLMMAGTVTTTELSAKDDQFFRPISSNDHHAEIMAGYLYQKRGVRRINAAVNLGNRSYTESWITNFEKSFTALGGKVDRAVRYASAQDTDFARLTKELLAGNPDAVILVTNAVDAALFANQVRQAGSQTLMATSEWAGTGKLIELGGGNVEGYIVPQYLNRQNTSPEFVKFRDAYRQRFQQDIGYPAAVAYDASRVLFKTLAERKENETLKQALLRIRTFPGLQEPIVFDDFGDVKSRTYLTRVKDGQYITIE